MSNLVLPPHCVARVKSPLSVLLAAALCCTAPAGAATMAAQPDTPPHRPAPAPTPGPSATPTSTHDPAPTPTSTPARPRYPDVEASRAAIRIDDAPGGRGLVRRVRAADGVAHATRIRVASSRAGGTDDGPTLTLAAVDPVEYRRFAPQVVADAVGVWRRLDDGEVAVMHEHAERLGLRLGGPVTLGGRGAVPLRVGALASNGVPPVAQALVDRATGARLGLDRVPPTILVAVEGEADPDAVAADLADDLGLDATVVPDPRALRPVTPRPPKGDTVWDRLAVCESSSDWTANTGNGYYGGLQFLPESWWAVGGRGLPHEASREEQIHRAELLLQRQDWVAWPVCSVRLGLRDP